MLATFLGLAPAPTTWSGARGIASMRVPHVVTMRAPHVVTGMRELASQYDAFLLDQFGVLHNGREALPGADACYARLAAAGKQLVVLSNTSRRRADALGKLPRMGFDAATLSEFVSSGEEAWRHLDSPACAGKKVLWLAWEDGYLGFENGRYLDGLDIELAGADTCDLVLAQGTQIIRDGRGDVAYDLLGSGVVGGALGEALRVCARRGVELLCANPDFVATQPDGSAGYMPGNVARRYAELGGSVRHFGKPHRFAFDAACRALGGIPRERICHVGDSLAHDIAGANAAGIDSVFIGAGIHAAELGLTQDALDDPPPLDPAALARLLGAEAERGEVAAPTYASSTFVW